MVKKKHTPPSRIKYEQNHPTVSFRLDKSLLDKLNSFLEKEKISKPDFIKIALKEQEENYYLHFFYLGKPTARKSTTFAYPSNQMNRSNNFETA